MNEALAEIGQLIARYGPLADAGDAAGAASLWTEDGVYAVGGMAEARGRAAIAGLLQGPEHQALLAAGCAHILSAPAVALAADGVSAVAVNHSIVLRRDESGGYAIHRVAANRWELISTADGWRIRRRDNCLLDGTAEARALLALG